MYKRTSASVLMTLATKMRLKMKIQHIKDLGLDMDANMLKYKMGLTMYHMY